MIRVLQVVGKMDRGGIETFLMNVYRSIDRQKVQFDFLTVSTDTPGAYDREILELGGRIYQIPSRRQGWLRQYRALHRFFKEHPEHLIVHAHVSSLTNVAPLRVASKHGVKCRVIHGHSTNQGGSKIHQYLHRVNRLNVDKYATDFFACSELAANWIYPKSIIRRDQYRVILNGIETSQFAYNEIARENTRNQLGVEGKYVVGHVGRFHPVKNHQFLIDVFARLLASERDSVLLLVGDGKLRTDIEKKVRSLGLSDKVMFLGVRSDISDLLQAMDVFVLPSFHEGFGVVLVEAQAAGLPCYVSSTVTREVDITGLVEFIDLNDSIEVWADTVLERKDLQRKTMDKVVRAQGYDIEQIARCLQIWYESQVV